MILSFFFRLGSFVTFGGHATNSFRLVIGRQANSGRSGIGVLARKEQGSEREMSRQAGKGSRTGLTIRQSEAVPSGSSFSTLQKGRKWLCCLICYLTPRNGERCLWNLPE